VFPAKNLSFLAEGLDRVITQYRGKVNLTAILNAFLLEAQELEGVIWDVIESQLLTRTIAPGPPDQALLQLADLVGCPVAGLSGPELSFLLPIWLLARRSKGRSEDLIGLLAVAFPGAFSYEEFPLEAYRVVALPVPDPALVRPVALALGIARPPEVAGVLAWGNWDATSTFYFGDASAGGAPGSDFEDSISRTYGTGFLSGIEV
jgi:hypothetical protein